MSAERYWEGRWRDEKAENERLKVLNADAGNRGHGWRYSASATPTVKRYLSPLALSQEHAVRGLLAKSVAEAVRFIAGGVAEGAPVLVPLIPQASDG